MSETSQSEEPNSAPTVNFLVDPEKIRPEYLYILFDGSGVSLAELSANDITYLRSLATDAMQGADYFDLLHRVQGARVHFPEGSILLQVADDILLHANRVTRERLMRESERLRTATYDANYPFDRTSLAAALDITRVGLDRFIEQGRLKVEVKEEEPGARTRYAITPEELERFRNELKLERGKRFLVYEGEGDAAEQVPPAISGIRQITREASYTVIELDRRVTPEECRDLTERGFRLLSQGAFEEYRNIRAAESNNS
ncbi:MAG: hypothetical protein AAB592_05545 [Patescibacteria group bacterium]